MAVALSIDPKSVVDSVPLALKYLSDRGEERGAKKMVEDQIEFIWM